MLKKLLVLTVLFLLMPAVAHAAHGYGPIVNPGAFPRQARAKLDDQGVVHLSIPDCQPISEGRTQTEQQIRTEGRGQ